MGLSPNLLRNPQSYAVRQNHAPSVVSLRCSECKQLGTFQAIPNMLDVLWQDRQQGVYHLGQRVCPNPNCHTHVFVVLRFTQPNTTTLVLSYPAERINFDASAIPALIVGALTEAITCHAARCYIAAAIMVRKTLELICAEKEAKGDNLHARILRLRTRVILPDPLMDGMMNLKLMGNDAAHVESKTYDAISETESRIAIEVTKEVLKALYQYESIVKQLEALKVTAP